MVCELDWVVSACALICISDSAAVELGYDARHVLNAWQPSLCDRTQAIEPDSITACICGQNDDNEGFMVSS